jgi:hypothetical protein
VPGSDLPLFRDHLSGFDVNILADEEIIISAAKIPVSQINAMPGNLSQQVIKSEFWRLGISTAYLCLDSDAEFIRPFSISDFLTTDGTPYTVIDEAHELLKSALANRKDRVATAFRNEAGLVQQFIGRVGKIYSFGPFPLVWHRAVWESLDHNYLRPRGMNLADAIKLAPIESRWYGEALLAFRAVDLMPSQALFKVYHYAWQYDQDRRAGITPDLLAQIYSGVIYQSSWDRDMDWPPIKRSSPSALGRFLRRKMGRI